MGKRGSMDKLVHGLRAGCGRKAAAAALIISMAILAAGCGAAGTERGGADKFARKYAAGCRYAGSDAPGEGVSMWTYEDTAFGWEFTVRKEGQGPDGPSSYSTDHDAILVRDMYMEGGLAAKGFSLEEGTGGRPSLGFGAPSMASLKEAVAALQDAADAYGEKSGRRGFDAWAWFRLGETEATTELTLEGAEGIYGRMLVDAITAYDPGFLGMLPQDEIDAAIDAVGGHVILVHADGTREDSRMLAAGGGTSVKGRALYHYLEKSGRTVQGGTGSFTFIGEDGAEWAINGADDVPLEDVGKMLGMAGVQAGG